MSRREDEAAMLKLYGLSTLDPPKWEDVQNEDAAVLDALGGGGGGGDGARRQTEMEDPLGLRARLEIPADMDLKSVAPTLLSSKQFSPSAFLSLHHPDATFADLERGIANLRNNVDERGEEVRILVEREFGRFVGVKATGDAVYRDMKSEFLAEGSDHGTREIREILKITAHKADTMFLPLLSNALKAQKLKSTVSVFERSKFLFGLPRSLRTHILAGRYDSALRDYNKGHYLYSSRPHQLLPVTAAPANAGGVTPIALSAAGDAGGEAERRRKDQQMRVINKVWGEVEKIMGEMRRELEGVLTLPHGTGGADERGIEQVEKSLEILLQLNPKEDPAWLYFEAQHQFIVSQMRQVMEASKQRIDGVRSAAKNAPLSEAQNVADLQMGVAGLHRQDPETVLAQSAGSLEWEAIVAMVKSLSDVLLHNLPTFWRICRGYIDGKFRKRDVSATSTSRRSPAQCRNLAADIVKAYIAHVAQFFTLSDLAVATSPNAEHVPAGFMPRDCNALTTGHYARLVLSEISECISEVENLGIAPASSDKAAGAGASAASDINTSLRNFTESARWRFIEVLCERWAQDAKLFYWLETWSRNPDLRHTTDSVVAMELYEERCFRTVWRIAGGSKDASVSKPPPIPVPFLLKAKNALFDSIYYLVDGLAYLVLSDKDEQASDQDEEDTRLILALSNVSHLKEVVIPRLIERFGQLFIVATAGDQKALIEAAEGLEASLLDRLAQRKADGLRLIVEDGLLRGGDWAQGGKPEDVRRYMLESLLYLVQLHAQVSDIAPNLVKRIIERMMEELALVIKDCFRQITVLSVGGMLTATLEIEFLHQTLGQFVTENAKNILNEIYSMISASCGPRSNTADLQNELEALKKILFEVRRATSGHYLCFKPVKAASKIRRDAIN